MATKPLTGRMVLIYALSAFGVILAANLALAFAAIGSFPGIEVRNGYVASQKFEAERAAQVALGWTADAQYENGVLHVAVNDRQGYQVPLSDIALKIGRPTTEAVDAAPLLAADATGYHADADLARGLWRVDILATGHYGERFRQQLQIEVK
ncbi:MAG: FixH family protein [Pseudomonadota bacterium]